MKSLKAFLDGALDLVLGSLCILCRGAAPPGAGGLCPACLGEMAPLAGPVCAVCGALVEPGDGEKCGECRREPRPYDFARSFTEYSGAARDAVLAFKYRRRHGLARPLASLMAPWAREMLEHAGGVDIIVPVPLSGKSLRERGYNQASLLARKLAKELGLPVDYTALLKVRHTPPQSRLRPEERLLNVRGAFGLSGAKPFDGARVMLLDDVLTTGATAGECARILRLGRAKRAVVLTFARALDSRPDFVT